ncbi:DUF2291 family protein [Lachnospiraceae bacterium JLR.KK008]
MKKKLVLMITAVMASLSITACGIVTVVPIGQESSFTGQQEFDSSAESSNDWTAVVDELKANATDAAQAIGAGVGGGTAVTGTAKIVEYNTETPKHYLLVTLDGYEGEVQIQAGGVYSGTALRDTQTLKGFESFTNQTEWSQYAKALNKEADTQVVAPLGLDESVAGKTVTFTGAAAESSGKIVITPVEMSIE